MNSFTKMFIFLLLLSTNAYSSEYLKIIKDIDSRISEIDSTANEFLVLCYSMYETTKDCELRYYINKFSLNLNKSNNSIKAYSNLLKLYTHINTGNNQIKYNRNIIREIFHKAYLDAFNDLFNTHIRDFNELLFLIQSNKVILRRWENLRDLLTSTEDFLINIDKKVSNSF
ncbi:hypothetical protein L0337_35125 [candidate division KSB1 bacterium]|nr:hypothetical protein [candidate division KSB1 bacterium]